MTSKDVKLSSLSFPLPLESDNLIRALEFVIANGGAFRTSEKWAVRALTPLVKQGVLKYENSIFAFNENVEKFFMELSDISDEYAVLYKKYRQLIISQREEFAGFDSNPTLDLSHFATTDQQLMFLAHTVSNLQQMVENLTESINSCVAVLNEVNISVSVLEAVVYNENSDS